MFSVHYEITVSRVSDTVVAMDKSVVTALETHHIGECSTSVLALYPSLLSLAQWLVISNEYIHFENCLNQKQCF